MAEPFKTLYNRELVEQMAARFPIDRARFVALAMDGLDGMELLDRAKHIRDALRATLPPYPEAIPLILAALDKPDGVSAFYYLPFVYYIATEGLDHFDLSMHAQEELTKRFTAEFSLRFFLAKDPARGVAWLERWSVDPNEHVRRLVSEGSRPRLPWAPRLVLADWAPIHTILGRLIDDPSEYVRRSVANHLGDIYKDDPATAIRLARAWARPDRMAVLKHGLRHAIKAKDLDALALFGAAAAPEVTVSATFSDARIGHHVDVVVELRGPAQHLTVDLAVHFCKATGRTGRKVFRLAVVDLDGVRRLKKRISLRQLTTRKHAPGWHAVEVQVNGVVFPVGGFELRE